MEMVSSPAEQPLSNRVSSSPVNRMTKEEIVDKFNEAGYQDVAQMLANSIDLKNDPKYGSEAMVFSIPRLDDFLIRVPHGRWAETETENPGELTLIDNPFSGNPNVVWPIAKIGSLALLRNQPGVPVGVSAKEGAKPADVMYKEHLNRVADMPQEAYDKLAETMFEIGQKGRPFDVLGYDNMRIGPDNQFYILDLPSEPVEGYHNNSITHMIKPLVDYKYAESYGGDHAWDIRAWRKTILEKSVKAAVQTGLDLPEPSDYEMNYIFQSAGMDGRWPQLREEALASRASNAPWPDVSLSAEVAKNPDIASSPAARKGEDAHFYQKPFDAALGTSSPVRDFTVYNAKKVGETYADIEPVESLSEPARKLRDFLVTINPYLQDGLQNEVDRYGCSGCKEASLSLVEILKPEFSQSFKFEVKEGKFMVPPETNYHYWIEAEDNVTKEKFYISATDGQLVENIGQLEGARQYPKTLATGETIEITPGVNIPEDLAGKMVIHYKPDEFTKKDYSPQGYVPRVYRDLGLDFIRFIKMPDSIEEMGLKAAEKEGEYDTSKLGIQGKIQKVLFGIYETLRDKHKDVIKALDVSNAQVQSTPELAKVIAQVVTRITAEPSRPTSASPVVKGDLVYVRDIKTGLLKVGEVVQKTEDATSRFGLPVQRIDVLFRGDKKTRTCEEFEKLQGVGVVTPQTPRELGLESDRARLDEFEKQVQQAAGKSWEEFSARSGPSSDQGDRSSSPVQPQPLNSAKISQSLNEVGAKFTSKEGGGYAVYGGRGKEDSLVLEAVRDGQSYRPGGHPYLVVEKVLWDGRNERNILFARVNTEKFNESGNGVAAGLVQTLGQVLPLGTALIFETAQPQVLGPIVAKAGFVDRTKSLEAMQSLGVGEEPQLKSGQYFFEKEFANQSPEPVSSPMAAPEEPSAGLSDLREVGAVTLKDEVSSPAGEMPGYRPRAPPAADQLKYSSSPIEVPSKEELSAKSNDEIIHLLASLRVKRNERKDQATTDRRTGLLNRLGFIKIFEKTVALVEHADRRAASRGADRRVFPEFKDVTGPVQIVYADLNKFKEANELLGRAGADTLLQEVANAIEEKLRPGDHAARLGGDEIAFILRGSPEEAVYAMERFDQAVKEVAARYRDRNIDLNTGLSAGIAPYEQGVTLEKLLARADDELYTVKEMNKQGGQARIVAKVFEGKDEDITRVSKGFLGIKLPDDQAREIPIDDLSPDQRIQEVVSLSKEINQWNHIITIDEVTGMLNEEGFRQRFEEVLANRNRVEFSAQEGPAAIPEADLLKVLILAIDNFKEINDEYGHEIGDEVLRSAKTILENETRAGDVTARLYGKHFALILHADIEDAKNVVQRIRERIIDKVGEIIKGGSRGIGDLRIGLSAGIVPYKPGMSHKDIMARADAALENAKDTRNITIINNSTSSGSSPLQKTMEEAQWTSESSSPAKASDVRKIEAGISAVAQEIIKRQDISSVEKGRLATDIGQKIVNKFKGVIDETRIWDLLYAAIGSTVETESPAPVAVAPMEAVEQQEIAAKAEVPAAPVVRPQTPDVTSVGMLSARILKAIEDEDYTTAGELSRHLQEEYPGEMAKINQRIVEDSRLRPESVLQEFRDRMQQSGNQRVNKFTLNDYRTILEQKFGAAGRQASDERARQGFLAQTRGDLEAMAARGEIRLRSGETLRVVKEPARGVYRIERVSSPVESEIAVKDPARLIPDIETSSPAVHPVWDSIKAGAKKLAVGASLIAAIGSATVPASDAFYTQLTRSEER